MSETTARRGKRQAKPRARSDRPKSPRTTLSPAQEAIIIELRTTLLLSLDDLLVVVRRFVNADCSRTALHRCLHRTGVSNLRDIMPQDPKAPAKSFKNVKPGHHLQILVKRLPKMPDGKRRRYLYAAIDRATRWVYIEFLPNKKIATAEGFLERLVSVCPIRIRTVFTDKSLEFTDSLLRSRSSARPRSHSFARACKAHDIEHRLIKLNTRRSKGMVERFNGRSVDAIKSTRFASSADLEKALLTYKDAYIELPQKALGGKTPIEMLHYWHEKAPECFRKPPPNIPGSRKHKKAPECLPEPPPSLPKPSKSGAIQRDSVLSASRREAVVPREAPTAHDATIGRIKDEQGRLEENVANLRAVAEKYELVSALLAAVPPSSDAVARFQSVLSGSFLPFANKESSLDQEARAIEIMRTAETQLIRAAGFRAISTKTIGAVGGGFSSGKSAFVNSFFSDRTIKLPTGIRPVTAIPSYVVADAGESRIYGFSRDGGRVEIDPDFYAKLSHDFVKAFRFNLKRIMPFMTVTTPLDPEFFEHLCLIDTPGYNAAEGNNYAAQDRATAQECLQHAKFLFWMVGLDANGTMPMSDIHFIEELELGDTEVFVVANKADIRSPDDIEDVLDDIEGCLEDYDIPYAGVSAYSAMRREELLWRRQSLFDFLREQNSPKPLVESLRKDIHGVCDMYRDAIQRDIDSRRGTKKRLKSLALDLLESGFEEAVDGDSVEKIDDRLAEIAEPFGTNDLEKQLVDLTEIREEFMDALNEFSRDLAQPCDDTTNQ